MAKRVKVAWLFHFTGDLIISEGVTTIGNKAFLDCIGFSGKLIIPESVIIIEDGAFWKCNFKNVYCKAITPPQLERLSFGFDVFSNPSEKTLYVPVGSKDAYLNAEGWKDFKFKEIVEMQF